MHKLSFYRIQIIGLSALTTVFLLSTVAFGVTLPGQAKSQTRLQNARLKACQARENGIKNRSTHLADMAKDMEDKFDAIAKRVEDYYANIVVPSGKTVTNYDALVLDIQTKKIAVQEALTKARDDFSGFSCTSDNPKGAMTQFREDMQAVQQALKNYRTSIKNLIVAVHSVTGKEAQQHSNVPAPTGQGNNGQRQ